MGGSGSGRKPDPVKRLLGFSQPSPTDDAISYLPNHSGDLSAGNVMTTPVNPNDPVNKSYVDTLTTNHPHQDVTTTATPTFDGLISTGHISGASTMSISGSAFVVNSAGNVGIGASIPTALLQVESSTAALLNIGDGTSFHLAIDNDGDIRSNTDNTYFAWDAGANRIGFMKKGGSTGKLAYGSASDFAITQSDAATIVSTSTFTDRMVIDNTGNVGIGTTSPDTKLQVVGDTKLGDDNTNYMEVGTTGDVVFVGGAGLPFGEIYGADTGTTITISGTTKTNKVQINSFAVDGVSNNTSPDYTNDHITITKAGMYMCNVSMHINSISGGTAEVYGYSVYKNNGATEFLNLHGQRNMAGSGGDEGSVSLSGIIDLAVNDTVEVWVWNNTNTDNLIVDDINLSLVQVGGT